MQVLQVLISGISQGCIYGLIAPGFVRANRERGTTILLLEQNANVARETGLGLAAPGYRVAELVVAGKPVSSGLKFACWLGRACVPGNMRRLIEQKLTAGDEELTPTMKLKRKPVNRKYRNLIESMYA